MKSKSIVPKGGKQRKGQFLWNKLFRNYNRKKNMNDCGEFEKVGFELWLISDKEFDKIMKKWEGAK